MSKSTLVKAKIPFTMVPNELLNCEKLSLKAKGLYSYMLSKPDNWKFTVQSLCKQLKDGQSSVQTAMGELKEFGWITYKKFSDGSGQYIMNTYAKNENHEKVNLSEKYPNVENPHLDENKTSPNVGNPHMGNPHVLIKKKEQKKKLKKTNKKETSEIDVLEPIQEDQLVSDSFSFFEEENKSKNKSLSLPFGFVEMSEKDKKEDIQTDLLEIGLSNSQIKALLRVHPIDLIEEAIIETFQAQYDGRINEKSSQYFYGVLRNLSSEKKLA